MYNNTISLQGPEAFDAHLKASRSLPFIGILAVAFLWIPFAFHGIYGLIGLKKSSFNYPQFPFFGNLKYLLQRVSGVGLLLFVPAHLYKTRIEPGFLNSTLNFYHMKEGLSEIPTFLIYCLGILGVSYHLANGLWQFSIGWGLVRSQPAIQRLQILSILFFFLMAAMGSFAMWGFLRY
jgi:succinate dehydrogenase / fumarate reductase cytochrome b subunit